MTERQLIADLLSALEYHTEQTRPIEFSRVAIQAAREYLQKPAQRQPLTDEQIESIYTQETGSLISDSPWALIDFARAIEAKHGIKEQP